MENLIIKEICETVPGYGCVTYAEGCCLYNFTRDALTRVAYPVVEVGTYIGRSTLCLAQAIKDSGVSTRVITIDVHAPFAEEVMKWARIFGLHNYITPITGDSKDVELEDVGNISVLFLDGAHGYDPITLELKKFGPRVVTGGYIIGHDFQSIATVKEAFTDYMDTTRLRLKTCGETIPGTNVNLQNMVYAIKGEPSVLVLGHKGYLGAYLTSNLNADTIVNIRGPYDYVINCIGKPSVEFCQENPELSEESNLTVVKKMIQDFPTAKFIHFSSYYVYDDVKMCTESSTTTDKYFYMKHKLESEKLVVEAKGIGFRLGKLFGTSPGKKQDKFTDYLLENNKVAVDTVLFNPTSLTQVLKVIKFELHKGSLFGIFNLSNKGQASHLEYTQFIDDATGNKKKISVVVKRKRSFDNYGRFLMDCSKLEQFIPLTDWRIDLSDFLKELPDAR